MKGGDAHATEEKRREKRRGDEKRTKGGREKEVLESRDGGLGRAHA